MREELTCKICDYVWNSRILNPKECPSCKNRNWNKDQKEKGGRKI